MLLLRFLAFLLGLFIVFIALRSALKTFVLPRSAPDPITRTVFRFSRRVFNLVAVRLDSYDQRDKLMAFYAPLGLVMLVPVLLFIIDVGYTLMYWAAREQALIEAFGLSGSSLLTLGFVAPAGLPERLLAFSEAAIGMVLVALLISYLPTIYSVFSQRELLVSSLETLAGSPPWCVQMIERHYWLDRLDELSEVWVEWERWFIQLEETHTSLSAIVFFRSQRSNRSWITAAGAVLDTAAFVRAAVNVPPDPRADLMIRAGYLALRYIALPYGFPLKADPQFPHDSISIQRDEFDKAFGHLESIGVPMRPDRDQAWRDFAGWRVNYDAALISLCALIMAPEAPWSSDRASGQWVLTPKFKTRNISDDADTAYRERKEAELPSLDGATDSTKTKPQPSDRLRRVDRRLLRRPRANRRRGRASNESLQLRLVRKRRANN